MRKWLLLLIFVFIYVPDGQAAVDLQQLIDEAKPGDTLILPKGEYAGELVISKPLTLKGNITLTSTGQNPVLTIQNTNSVHIEGLTIQTPGTAVEVKKSNRISIAKIELQNVNAGIKVFNSAVVDIHEIIVNGREGHYSKKGNGIGLYRSEAINVTDVKIDNVQDGIYIEEVKDITLKQNQVTNSRYGTHFMYAENAVAQSNTLNSNVTGFMVMMTKDVVFEENLLTKQRGLNGYGVVFYDVQNVQFDSNVLSLNRTAISLQNSQSIEIRQNHFKMNETAVEATRSDGSNVVSNNTFTGNILTARSDINGVKLNRNYYDDYAGIDANDDGIGDTSYVALSSFGQWMVREPAFQYFVEAPAVTVLAKVDEQINRSSGELLSDTAPLMESTKMQGKSATLDAGLNSWQLSIGLLLVLLSAFWWKRGIQT